ncbi:MAG: CPBP family intramembrane glutamic endopeptidase [Bacillota bacterium]
MRERRAQRLRLLWMAGLAAPAAMVLIGSLVSWIFRREIPDLWHLPSAMSVLLGLLTAGASMGLITLLYKSSKTFEQALRRSGTRVGEEALRFAGYPVMLVVVVMAGLGEEVLFRGGLQPVIGLVPAALLFGFSHGGWRREMWAYALAASISGGLFGLVYKVAGDLWVPVIAHALHNIMATLLLGKRVEISREGIWPVVRLLPEEDEEDEEEGEDQLDEPVGESVPAETDSPADGADDRPAADRPPE